jgi:putative ABC transport system permease protein
MARVPAATAAGKGKQALVELKAVDANYPLTGQLLLKGGAALAEALKRPGTAVCDPLLLDRLGLKLGDKIRVGATDIELAGLIEAEPDKLSGQAIYGPRLLMALPTLEAAGLAAEGSLIRWQYKIVPPVPAATDIKATAAKLSGELGKGGFLAATRLDPVPGARRAVERLGQFLTLVGFTTLGIGGLGVANAVGAHLIRMRKTIATLRSLGASDGQVFGIYLAQIVLLTLLGIIIGAALGTYVPNLAIAGLGQFAPVDIRAVHQPLTYAIAAAFGLLIALLFTLWPLGRAEQIRATSLFRDEVAPLRQALPRWPYAAATALLAAAVFGLLLLQASDRWLAMYSVGGLLVLAAVLLLFGWLIEKGFGWVPKMGPPSMRVALSNISGPQSLARPVMLSLGCGLGLLTALSLVDVSLERELRSSAPLRAPNYYLLDLGRTQLPELTALLDSISPGASVDAKPMLRGRVVSLKGTPVEQVKAPREVEWFLQGDRGLSYADAPPANDKLLSGAWWAKDYAGPPLVSLDEDIARGFGLAIGDSIVVNVLGRPIEAKVANLRKVSWERLVMNFTMILSPVPLRNAPHNLMGSVTYPNPLSPAKEGELLQAVADTFPGTAAIRVKDGLDLAASVIDKVIAAVRVAALVTLSAGSLVLAGAMTAARRRRSYQAVVLKVLGATTGTVIATMMWEYGLLAVAAALVALALGIGAAWALLTYGMQITFIFSWPAVLSSAGIALALLLIFGIFGTYQVLRARPMPLLRSE